MEHKRVWTNNELEDLVRQLSLALEATQLGIWQHNITKNQTRWDEQLQRIYGVEKGLLDVVWLESVHPDDLVAAQAIFEQAVDSRCDYASEFRIVTPEGYVRYIRSRAKFFIDVNSDPCFIGAEWDVTEDVLRATQLAREHEAAERSRAEARHAADHDYLTGLRNRRAFDRLLDEDLGDNVTEMALAHIDIDHFKEINDRFGHAGGDKVLKHVAHIIRSVVSHDEVGVRLGGDEFAVLVKQGAERLHTVVTAIRAALAFPVEIDATSVQIECSIGLATAPKSDANTLLSYSDIALYEAKRSGRNRDTLFSPEMAAKAAASRSMLGKIRRGIENSDFLPYYQVQVDAKSGQVVGLEALARWASPGGLRTPVDFLELAAMNGLLEKLDDMILRKVLSDLARWTLADLDPPRVSVNLSAARLEDPTLPQKLARLAIPKGRVSFELIETIFLDKLSNQAKANIAAIRDLGIGIEIDDLGSGHASLLGLLELKPDRVKLDKFLVIPAGHDVAPRTLVSSLVQIARALASKSLPRALRRNCLLTPWLSLGWTFYRVMHLANRNLLRRSFPIFDRVITDDRHVRLCSLRLTAGDDMTSEDKKASLATRFAERVPSSQGDADVSLEVDSFTMFSPLEGGDLLARLALTSDETFDLAINPVCALRLAATILDQLHKSGDYVVELSIYDGASGNQVARIRP